MIDADGSNNRQLTDRGGWNPAWSPDGARIVFTRYISTDIFVMMTTVPIDGWSFPTVGVRRGRVTEPVSPTRVTATSMWFAPTVSIGAR